MLASDKIGKAFLAIVEEAEKLQNTGLSADVGEAVKTIISIAKHQSDIRSAGEGSCTTKKSGCGCKK